MLRIGRSLLKRQFCVATFCTWLVSSSRFHIPQSTSFAVGSAVLTMESGSAPQQLISSGDFSAQWDRPDSRTHRVKLFRAGQQLTWSEVAVLWADDLNFGAFYSEVLAASPFDAFYWECAAVNDPMANRLLFEHVTVKSHGFAPASPDDFSEYFGGQNSELLVTSFANLGGDSLLVCPTPQGPLTHYGHLAAFVRGASADQKQALWRAVGQTLLQTLQERGARYTWVSTEGSGVPWLHVRLDSRPKYFHYAAYTATSQT